MARIKVFEKIVLVEPQENTVKPNRVPY